MKQEKMRYRLFCFLMLIGAIALGIWYFTYYTGRNDFTKNSTMVKNMRNIGCMMGEAGKSAGSSLKKGLKCL